MIANFPYMSEIDIVKLTKYINRETKMLEVGGGGSSKFISKFVKELKTVEHNKSFAKNLNDELGNLDNWDIDLIEPNFKHSHPFHPAKPNQFNNYVNHLKSLSKNYYDVVLIDGRDRLRSARASLDSLVEGGYLLIHDFWDREKYHDLLNWHNLELVHDSDRIFKNRKDLQLAVFKKVTPSHISNNKVFLYWHGKEFRLIKMLRDLVYQHSNRGKNYQVHLLTQNNLIDYIDYIPDNFYNLSLNHQSDFIRAAVICKHGGIYLDSDVIVMNNLKDLFDDIENHNAFFIRENGKDVMPSVFGSKPNTPHMKRWLSDCINLIESGKNLGWTAFVSDLYKGYEKNNQLNDCKIYNGLNTMYPVNWDNCLNEFVEKPKSHYKEIETDFQPVIILVNSVYRWMERFRIEEIPTLDNPLAYFLNKSKENI